MSTSWASEAQHALSAGTRRRTALPVVPPAVEAAVGRHHADLEGTLLGFVAADQLTRRAMPTVLPAREPLLPPPPDGRRMVSARLQADVDALIGGRGRLAAIDDQRALLLLLLEGIASTGRRLPPERMPMLLDRAGRLPRVQPAAAEVAGTLGLWLGRQRDNWQWVVRHLAPVERWDAGDRHMHTVVALLTRDPAAGLERIEAAWNSLPVEHRRTVVTAIPTPPPPQSLALLERAAADPDTHVAVAASEQLIHFADSSLARALRVRARGLLVAKRSFLRRGVVVDVSVVDDSLDAFLRPVLRSQRPYGTADRITALVGSVPLRTWESATGMRGADLAAAVAGTEWSDAVLQGWVSAARTFGDDPVFAMALLTGHWQAVANVRGQWAIVQTLTALQADALVEAGGDLAQYVLQVAPHLGPVASQLLVSRLGDDAKLSVQAWRLDDSVLPHLAPAAQALRAGAEPRAQQAAAQLEAAVEWLTVKQHMHEELAR